MPRRAKFTDVEISSMRDASARGHKAWDENPKLKTLKAKIKIFGKIKAFDTCCYCMRDVHGEFNMVLDIEHILPKSEYVKHMFTGKNLAVSCKRCNMNIKGVDLGFLVSKVMPRRVLRSRYYKFIHPNLDRYDAHLLRIAVQRGRAMIVKYDVVNQSPKGLFTYQYFELERLERSSFDKAQGLSPRAELEDNSLKKAFDLISKVLVS